MMKHYAESHEDIELEKMRVIQKYRTSFERQIGESIHIKENSKKGTRLLNSINEYNRCIIPRLTIEEDEDLEEYLES